MFEATADLEAEYAGALAALPIPLPPAGVRCLRTLSARDHSAAQLQRRTALTLPHSSSRRAGHLRRSAALAEARSVELAAEVR